MITVIIPAALRKITQKYQIIVEGDNLHEVLTHLINSYPALEKYIYHNNKILPYVTLYLNNQDIRYLPLQETRVNINDTLTIIPAVAGG